MNRARTTAPSSAASCAIAALLLLSAPVFAAEAAAEVATATSTSAPASPYRLGSSQIESAPQQSGRFALNARFAPQETAGELIEGAQFTLIGRFAKGGVMCGGGLFADGFEGN